MKSPLWLRQLSDSLTGRHARPARRPRNRLSIESLEAREVPAGFSFPDFSPALGLELLGAATINSNDHLRLSSAAVGGSGSAWYTAEKQFVGLSFETTFQFQLTEGTDPPGGSDGFVFLIQNTAPTYLAGGGGTLGYHGLKNSLAVEFDTFQNGEVNDPSPSHISVHTNGTGANDWSESLSLGSYNTNPIMDDGAVHSVKIAYTPGSLSIFLDDLSTPKLTVAVDLAEKLNLSAGQAWLGFTAASGGARQNHDILNWTHTVIPDVTTTVWASDASVTEGDADTSSLNFTIIRSGDTSGTTSVNWTTENRSAIAGSDYVTDSGQVTFGPGDMQHIVTVLANGDAAIEPHETFVVRLSNASGASIADGVGIGTILTDDVSVSISDASAIEGDATIQPLGAFVASPDPYAMILGPDGYMYVGDYSGAVYRYDAATGSPLPAPGKPGAEFVSPGSGGLSGVRDIAFGPDDYLYAVSETTDSVLRYDPATGAFAGTLVASGAAGLDQPRGLAFRNGYVFVTSVGVDGTPGAGKDSVLRYNAATGAPAGVSGLPSDAVFIASGSGGLDNPSRLVFGADGMAYVSSTATTQFSATANSVLRYDGVTGAPAGISGQPGDAVFVSPGSGGLDGPVAMVFRPDGLFVTSWRNNSVFRYQASSGAFGGVVVPSGAGGASVLIDLLFEPGGNLLVTSRDTNQVLRYGAGSQASFTVSLSSPSATPVTVSYATVPGSATAGSDYTATSGTLTFAPGQTSRTILVPTLDDAIGEPTETFTITLSNPVGATIADGQGTGTILDNETKFFVLNDATTNQTYEYASEGTSVESYALNSGNSAPRGAASTAAGDKVWVVDANRTVYVYNTSGGLLGSWTAGSMNGSAQVEGIATNGTDVWIVDAKQDKVFKYTGAASRLSGSQNAASNFSLNTGNKDAKGIVTDGASFWVVNDSSTDKVFKYTLAGALLGSWTITGGGGAPTGITLDPTDVAHLWIVDNGTDRVYQYNNAVGRTSGSQASSTSFALSAGNTNPQDIANPPVSANDASDSFIDRSSRIGSQSNRTREKGDEPRKDLSGIRSLDVGHNLGNGYAESGTMSESLTLGVRTIAPSGVNQLWGFLPPIEQGDQITSPTIARAKIGRFAF